MADPNISSQFTLPTAPTTAAIGADVNAMPPVQDYAERAKKVGTSPQAILQEQGRVLQRQEQLDREIKANKMAQEEYLGQAEASIATQERERTQQIEAGIEAKKKEFPYPELHPTKENIPELAGLFSLIGVIGVGMGGSGKQSAINSMTAMSGMMKGWQQGRADLWNREKQEFDKEMSRVKAILDDAYKDADRAYKMLATNRKEAEALAKQSAAKLGSQVANQILERQGTEPYHKYLENLLSNANKILDRAVKTSKSTGGALPKDKETLNQYRTRYEVIKNLEDLDSMLNNPKYAKYITPGTTLTPDIIANLQRDFPELQTKLARIQAQEFLIGGKALTASEQKILEPIYGWRGLTVDALRKRLAEGKRATELTNALVEKDYPGLSERKKQYDQAYEALGGNIRNIQENVEQPEYSVNDIIVKGNKRYKVTAIIKDKDGKIVDYDVEEVKVK